MYLREDQAAIHLTVDGVAFGDGHSWLTYAGGGLSAAGAKTRAGGMGREVELGGPATRADATITIQNSEIMVGQHSTLEYKCGRGQAKITIQYLDRNGNTISGARFSVKGILKEAHLPGQNGESPTAGMYQVVVACDELAA